MLADPSYERYVMMRKHARQEPMAGGAEDTTEEFVARVHRNVVRVPKRRYRLRGEALDSVRRELALRELEFCALRGAYLYSKQPEDRLVERTKSALESIQRLRAEARELEGGSATFVSQDSRPASASTSARPAEALGLQDSALKEGLREAKRKGFEKRFLFKTYEECNSANSKKAFYMSKDRLAKTVEKYYPELLKNRKGAKSLTKRDLCAILFE